MGLDIQAVMSADPPRGIYAGVPEELYHNKWTACNRSRLEIIHEKSEAHCYHEMSHPRKETDALAFGRALHSLVLEPANFDRTYAVSKQCAAQTKTGSPCSNPGKYCYGGEWRCGKHTLSKFRPDAVTAVTPEDMYAMTQMRENLFKVTEARAFIESEGHNEVSHVWIDKETGIKCKMRVDMLREKVWDAIGDLKSTDSAKDDRFTYSATKYGYNRQAAWYLDGREALGKPIRFFNILAMEKEPPYLPNLFTIDDDAVKVGRIENRLTLRRYAKAIESGKWPGYAEQGFRKLTLTDSAFYRHYKEQGYL